MPAKERTDGVDEVVVSVIPEAKPGWDRYDAPQPASLDRRQPLSLLDADGARFRAMAIPEPSSEVRIRLSASARITHSDLEAAVVGDVLVLGQAESAQPEAIALLRAWPNPFNPVTTIGFTAKARHHAEAQDLAPLRLVVVDMLGREVAVLVDGKKEPGDHSVAFDASGLASGVYLVRLIGANGAASNLKLTLLK
jgi:hypothetical protein